MSKNLILRPRTRTEIDQRVERVLNDLGNPTPPLDLRLVLELLRLDRGFYTADDPGVVRKMISRIRVGALQTFARPMLLLEVMRKFDLRGLYIPDGKRILIDQTQPEAKHRWLEAHEIGHSLIPWHDETMFGDSSHTLAPACHEHIEAEANYAAGRLLFLREQFVEEAQDHTPSIASVTALKKRYGNTLTTTLWRCVETWGDTQPVVGLLTTHPHPRFRNESSNTLDTCRHFIQSPAFAVRFSKITAIELFANLTEYCGPQKGGPLGAKEVVLNDDDGVAHVFFFETFFNRHDALTLGIYRHPGTSI